MKLFFQILFGLLITLAFVMGYGWLITPGRHG